MKRLLLFSLLLLTQLARSQNIPPRPNPPRPLNDFAHVLTADQAQALEQKLLAYNDSTSSQIVIVTVETTGDDVPEEYALKILRDWGVGSKKNNNGVVILAAINDHKLRIEVGDGLEGAIPDITAKQIIDNEISPNFRQGNYYRGFDNAVDAIVKATAGEYKAEERPAGRDRSGNYSGGGRGGGNFIGIGVIFFIIIIIAIFRNRGGGDGGGTINRGGFLPWLILGSMMNNRGGGSDWGGGGGWGGGGDSGGGGGFDFGGGSGSGGGASGSW
jgi:uncharacterized protein